MTNEAPQASLQRIYDALLLRGYSPPHAAAIARSQSARHANTTPAVQQQHTKPLYANTNAPPPPGNLDPYGILGGRSAPTRK